MPKCLLCGVRIFVLWDPGTNRIIRCLSLNHIAPNLHVVIIPCESPSTHIVGLVSKYSSCKSHLLSLSRPASLTSCIFHFRLASRISRLTHHPLCRLPRISHLAVFRLAIFLFPVSLVSRFASRRSIISYLVVFPPDILLFPVSLVSRFESRRSLISPSHRLRLVSLVAV